MFCTKQYLEQWKPQSRSNRRNDIFGWVIGLYQMVFTTHSFRHDPTQHSFRLGAGWHSKKKTNTIICNAHKCAFDVGILQVFLSIWLVYCSLFFFSNLFSRFIVILNSCRYVHFQLQTTKIFIGQITCNTCPIIHIHNSNESFHTIHQSVVWLLCIA